MAGAKTIPTGVDVEAFIESVKPASKRAEAKVLLEAFQRITGEPPQMWGPSMIGFGQYHYKYESGREGDMLRTGFSPRKAKHSLYLMGGYCDEATAKVRKEQLKRLGKHSTGKSCLYINKLADVDMDVLEEMIATDWDSMNRKYPA
ncbi:MAG: DUF1801 domain-containing protein [Pseudomonadota bacterium]